MQNALTLLALQTNSRSSAPNPSNRELKNRAKQKRLPPEVAKDRVKQELLVFVERSDEFRTTPTMSAINSRLPTLLRRLPDVSPISPSTSRRLNRPDFESGIPPSRRPSYRKGIFGLVDDYGRKTSGDDFEDLT